MQQKVTQKLIRDLVPELAEGNGDILETVVMDEAEFKEAVRIKLVEEVGELAAASEETFLEELSDVVEVLNSLMEAHGISWEELEGAMEEKFITHGGFEERLKLVGKRSGANKE